MDNDATDVSILRSLAEEIAYMRDEDTEVGNNDELIRATSEAYKRVAGRIGMVSVEGDE